MAVVVTLQLMLPEWWGADMSFEAGGTDQVKELILEDPRAFLDEARWEIEYLPSVPAPKSE